MRPHETMLSVEPCMAMCSMGQPARKGRSYIHSENLSLFAAWKFARDFRDRICLL